MAILYLLVVMILRLLWYAISLNVVMSSDFALRYRILVGILAGLIFMREFLHIVNY